MKSTEQQLVNRALQAVSDWEMNDHLYGCTSIEVMVDWMIDRIAELEKMITERVHYENCHVPEGVQGDDWTMRGYFAKVYEGEWVETETPFEKHLKQCRVCRLPTALLHVMRDRDQLEQLLIEVNKQVGNVSPAFNRHALTPKVRDEMTALLREAELRRKRG